MTLPVRERVLVAVKAKLDAITLPGLQVDRNRTTAAVSFPALNQVDGGQTPDNSHTVVTFYEMQVSIEGAVQGISEATIGTDLNQLYAAVVTALVTDNSLNGTAVDIVEGEMVTAIVTEDDEHVTGSFDLGFTITYQTKGGDPFTIAP